MTTSVTDVRSNLNDQIAYAAKVLGRAKDRIAVFLAIHHGKKKVKTATEIAKRTGLKRKRVLEEGKKLVHKQVVRQHSFNGEIGYERDSFCYAHKSKIVNFARNPTKLRALPTKYAPAVAGAKILIRIPRNFVRTAVITINNIDSFYRVKSVRKILVAATTVSESRFKHGIQKIIGEAGRFKDWGGETSDLWTTRLRLNGARRPAAFAFKGPGTRGLLTPARLGKNGDQIQRLFIEDADVFIVQYVGQVAPTVIQQMASFAQNKSLATGRKIYYGVVDGNDTARLIAAYPAAFRKPK